MAKSVLIPFALTAIAAATDVAIQHKMFGSDLARMLALRPPDLALRTTALKISNKKMNDIMKIVKSLEESHFLIKDVSETIKNEVKQQKEEFLTMFLLHQVLVN